MAILIWESMKMVKSVWGNLCYGKLVGTEVKLISSTYITEQDECVNNKFYSLYFMDKAWLCLEIMSSLDCRIWHSFCSVFYSWVYFDYYLSFLMTFEDKCYGQSFLILNEFKENICTLHDNTQNVFLGINEKYETLYIWTYQHTK